MNSFFLDYVCLKRTERATRLNYVTTTCCMQLQFRACRFATLKMHDNFVSFDFICRH